TFRPAPSTIPTARRASKERRSRINSPPLRLLRKPPLSRSTGEEETRLPRFALLYPSVSWGEEAPAAVKSTLPLPHIAGERWRAQRAGVGATAQSAGADQSPAAPTLRKTPEKHNAQLERVQHQ